MFNLTALANEIHTQNVAVGWWDDWEVKTDRHENAMMLVVSEIAEAMEGDRKDLMDDHLPEFKAFDVELADAMIRLLDLAGAYEIATLDDDRKHRVKHAANFFHGRTVVEQLFFVVKQVCYGGMKQAVKSGVYCIEAVAMNNNVDLWKLVELKRAYNKERADHKRENRSAAGGKSY